jgi:glycerol-3-phosphate O-acyltransferase
LLTCRSQRNAQTPPATAPRLVAILTSTLLLNSIAMMMLKRSCMALLLTSSVVSAFTTAPRALFSNSRLFSSTKEPETTETTSTLTPEFQAALDQSAAMLKASIDEDKSSYVEPLLYFMKEYFTANQASCLKGNKQAAPDKTAKRFLDGIQLGMTYGMGATKYRFGVSHTAMRGNPETEEGNTRDYYEFGCDFFRHVMDLEDSVVLGKENLDQAFEYIQKGENVVFLANHQSEADPQVFSCMLEKVGYGKQAEEVIYVAGHKVTTDPLAIPFSMGRNLVCIHSKKHIDR